MNESDNFNKQEDSNTRGTTTLEDDTPLDKKISSSEQTFKMPSEPVSRKTAMATQQAFQMPSSPVSRKTALVTPKSKMKSSNTQEFDLSMSVELRTLRTYFLNGEFRKANSFLVEKLMKELHQDQRTLYNVCLTYVFLKLKEYENARTLAQDLLSDFEK